MNITNIEEFKRLESEVLQLMIIKARTDFYTYVRLMAPVILPEGFVDGTHLQLICEEMQKVVESVEDPNKEPIRLQLWMPPGSMKSKTASNLLPSWSLGRNPNWCFLALGMDSDFAVDNFGRPTKDIIETPQYQAIFPGTRLRKDVKSAGRWYTSKKGVFVAKGWGQGIAGRRAHISICDDLLNEHSTDADLKDVRNWYLPGLRSRLLPNGAEIVINTRWFPNDLSGYVVELDKKSERPWRIIKIPALLDETASTLLKTKAGIQDDPDNHKFDIGTSFWPELWPTRRFEEIKAVSDPVKWSALYQQEPISVEGSIVKREDFQVWTQPHAPQCHSIIVSIDTGLSQKDAANPSAFTVWGVFTNLVETFDNTTVSQECMILLSAWQGRCDFAELCNKCHEIDKKYYPDYFLIEETSAGLLLIPELQKRSLPVLPYKPDRDKTYRLQATTPYFRAKRVWIPKDKSWAEDVVSEVISFQPRLKNQKDDYTDTVSQVIIWMRDNFKIDNDAYSNTWDDDIKKQRINTYWSSALTKK
jgi:predicted phage terminase large subunit-like protein